MHYCTTIVLPTHPTEPPSHRWLHHSILIVVVNQGWPVLSAGLLCVPDGRDRLCLSASFSLVAQFGDRIMIERTRGMALAGLFGRGLLNYL